jgi:hypothetical protein
VKYEPRQRCLLVLQDVDPNHFVISEGGMIFIHVNVGTIRSASMDFRESINTVADLLRPPSIEGTYRGHDVSLQPNFKVIRLVVGRTTACSIFGLYLSDGILVARRIQREPRYWQCEERDVGRVTSVYCAFCRSSQCGNISQSAERNSRICMVLVLLDILRGRLRRPAQCDFCRLYFCKLCCFYLSCLTVIIVLQLFVHTQ